MANFLIAKASEIWTYGGAATGTVDSDYDVNWLVDAVPGRPVRATGTSLSASITFTSNEVGLVALTHSNANVNATVGGGVSATITAGALQDDGIRLNGFTTVTPTTTGSLTLALSGASSTIVVGQFVAAKYRTLSLPVYTNDMRSDVDFTRKIEMDLASIAPYDPGLAGRMWEAGFLLTSADVDVLRQAFLAQRNGTRPTLVVQDSTVNDAQIGFLSAPKVSVAGPLHFDVTVTFTEIPRVRWP